MRKTHFALLAAAAVLCGAGFAGAETAKPAAKAPAAAKAAMHTASGTVESFDVAAKTLTVKGAKDSWTFSVADAQVWKGSKSVAMDELASVTGSKATVKYSEKDGTKMASSVHVAPASAKATAKKAAK